MARSPGKTLDYNRVMARFETMIGEFTLRIEDKFDAQDQRLRRMEHDLAAGALGQESLRNEINEQRNDAGEVRDLVHKLKAEVEKMKSGAVSEAARGAAEGVAQASNAAMHRDLPAVLKREIPKAIWWKSRGGAVFLSGIIIVALSEIADKGPKIARLLGSLFEALVKLK